MAVYYNEVDPFCVQWLRNLMAAGHLPDGEVDPRPIQEVDAGELEGFDQCHFFAGIGAWSYAIRLAGWPDERPVWTGSCPCQPFSVSGKRKGRSDERHLWPVWFDLIRQRRPTVVFGEQVAGSSALSWFDDVSSDLEGEGYAVGAADLCAAGVGAPQLRQRLYFVAGRLGHSNSQRFGRIDSLLRTPNQGRAKEEVLEVAGTGEVGSLWDSADWVFCRDPEGPFWRPVEPSTFPLAPRTPNHVGRLRAYGNSIVAPLAAEFIKSYMDCRP